MERLRALPQEPYPVSEEPIVLSKGLLDILLKQECPSDLISLYCFYYYTAKWQKTDRVKATTAYTAVGLKWTEGRVRKTKNILRELNLVEDYTQKDEHSKIVAHYVRVHFIWKSHPSIIPQCGSNPTVAKREGNALSTDTSIADEQKNGYITPTLFEQFWAMYPKKVGKGAALTKWHTICERKGNRKPPTWSTMRKALHEQMRSEQWQNELYIPHPATWLNQSRWLDDASKMVEYKKKPREKYYDGIRYTEVEEGVFKNRAGEIWTD